MFNQQLFVQHLHTKQLGRPLHWFDTLSSTNSTLWQLLDGGAEAGTTVIAAQQEAGRGQWGRQWQSLPGGLYLSVAIAPYLAAQKSHQLTLCSAWGLATTLRNYSLPIQIKWPNDLLLHGRKLGGILTETRLQQGQITTAVIGIGLNWSNAVPETGINLQSLDPTSIHSLEMLAAITLEGLEFGYQQWQNFGIKGLLADYLKLMTHLDQPVVVEDQVGKVIGVSEAGSLQVQFDSADPPECLPPGTISLSYSDL